MPKDGHVSQYLSRELNPRPSSRESNTLTTSQSVLLVYMNAVIITTCIGGSQR